MIILITSIVVISVVFIAGALITSATIQHRNFLNSHSQSIPGYQLKISGSPFDSDTIAKCLDLTTAAWIELKGNANEEIKNKFNQLIIDFVPGTVQEDGEIKRYIIDDFGRKIAGDTSNNIVRVVFLPSDGIGNTALVHELCHALHAINGVIDYDHADELVWGRNGVVAIVKSKLSS